MKKIITMLFPFKLHLTILQLEEYKPARFLNWIFKNFFTRKIELKKPLIFTHKIKLIIYIYIFYFFLSLPTIILPIIFLTNPFIIFTLAVITLKPHEAWNKTKVINKTRKTIDSFNKTTVIGITGSYGKTSTKDILYQLLKTKYKILKTPASYNTVFGIKKVVDLELDPTYDFFLVEMGAYTNGEIAELCQMTNPKYGILTGIDKQHLERFKNISNIIKTKFELYDYIKNPNYFVFNTQNNYINTEIKNRDIKYINKIQISNPKLIKSGLFFNLKYQNKNYKITTPLFGLHHITNLQVAIEMALKLDIPISEIQKTLSTLKSPSKRFELKKIGDTTIVDNTYNSNPVSFTQTIESAKLVSGKKALITPGLVELGEETKNIHAELGKKSTNAFNQIILVGKSIRTESFYNNSENKKIIKFIPDTRQAYQDTINKLVDEKYDWIFLENDLTQNY